MNHWPHSFPHMMGSSFSSLYDHIHLNHFFQILSHFANPLKSRLDLYNSQSAFPSKFDLHIPLLFGCIDLKHFQRPVNRVRFTMGKLGCTANQTRPPKPHFCKKNRGDVGWVFNSNVPLKLRINPCKIQESPIKGKNSHKKKTKSALQLMQKLRKDVLEGHFFHYWVGIKISWESAIGIIEIGPTVAQ